jgi:hypothetical protein
MKMKRPTMKRTCEKCGEEFELTLDKPGRIGICPNCVQDPERASKLNGEIVVNGQTYKKVGLPLMFDVPE